MWQSDDQWVRRCLGEQPDAFRHLVERHEGALVGYLIGRLADREEAAEAAQETFVRAYFALGKLHKPEAFFSWLLGIADRVTKEVRRKRQRRPASLDACAEPAAAETAETTRPELSQAVAALPEPYREVILRRYYGGRSCAEISRDLDIPVGTVTKRLSRAYALLREALREDERTTKVEVRR
jgi:RNA polymerase sigma-70 factor (ECF subfamily)